MITLHNKNFNFYMNNQHQRVQQFLDYFEDSNSKLKYKIFKKQKYNEKSSIFYNICLTGFGSVRIVQFFAASAAYFDD